MRLTFSLSPFCSSLFWMEPMIRRDARRAPTTFLYATDRRLRSCQAHTGEDGALL